MSSESSPSALHHVEHLIIGAGFGGICAAIKLDEDSERDYVVIERGSDVGGTWRDNTYPGAACDVPSQLYSFSFALNPDWSASFSPQPEIQAYLRDVADHAGIRDRIVFDTTVTDAAWDAALQRWIVTATSGTETTTYAARTLIAGPGALSEPHLPDIAGLDEFTGELFHSARWHHEVDLRGKRVAVIGTGASAIQIIPEIQATAAASGGHLDVYQRTAPWVIPRNEHRYSSVEKAAFRHVPGLQRLARTAIYWAREAYVPAFAWQPKIAAPARAAALRNIAQGIADPELRAAVTPSYEIGCKRILISNRYYPALAAETTDVITTAIDRVTPTGVVTADGVERPVDVIIVATGFETTDIPIAHHIRGIDGELMADRFERSGAAAFKGTTVPGFPNLFFIVGPNTGLGHSSMVFIIESQVQYLRAAIRTMRREGLGSVEPTAAAYDRWNAMIQKRIKRSVWNTGGCSSWYLDEAGRNTTLWPGFTFDFRARLRAFDLKDYWATPAHHSEQELIDA